MDGRKLDGASHPLEAAAGGAGGGPSMNPYFYENAAGQRFSLPERPLEPRDARMDYVPVNPDKQILKEDIHHE